MIHPGVPILDVDFAPLPKWAEAIEANTDHIEALLKQS
jgi:hypothetical protein